LRRQVEEKSAATAIKSLERKRDVVPVAQKPPGGRHDNDFEDFRKVTVLPTAGELLCSEASFVPQNIPVNCENLQSYLDMEFRLLREDLVRPLQTGLAMFLQAGGVAGLGKKEVFRADEGGNTKIFVHRDVSLKGLVVDKCHLPVMFLVEFSHSALMEKLSSKERQRKWEVSRK
jgi:hypothetical protein